MSDDSTMFSTGSLQTFIAGAFIIALLDLQSVATSVATADDGSGAALTDLQTKVDALAVQVKKLEESAAQAAAALPAPE
ncbi:MAG: hypothetical protein JRJ84_03100 [Deltaproteobacteria bacterium]|nr:hypothetical protein [Deltaproteobacteria bacterium]